MNLSRNHLNFSEWRVSRYCLPHAQLDEECTPVHLRQSAGMDCEGTIVNIVVTNIRWRPFDVLVTIHIPLIIPYLYLIDIPVRYFLFA